MEAEPQNFVTGQKVKMTSVWGGGGIKECLVGREW